MSAIVPMSYWEGEGKDAHVVRSQGLRVVLFYHEDGHPAMVVDRKPNQKPGPSDEHEDELMMRWNRTVHAQIRSATAPGTPGEGVSA